MGKLSGLPTETTIALNDLLVKVKAAGAGDVLITLQNFLNSIGGNNFLPYKFSVYRNAAWTASNGSFGKVSFDTKLFDTGSNYDATTNFRFTAPVAGFYWFSAGVGSSVVSGGAAMCGLWKNSSEVLEGSRYVNGAATFQVNSVVSGILQLAAGDFIEVFYYASGGSGATGQIPTYFHGYLLSAT